MFFSFQNRESFNEKAKKKKVWSTTKNSNKFWSIFHAKYQFGTFSTKIKLFLEKWVFFFSERDCQKKIGCGLLNQSANGAEAHATFRELHYQTASIQRMPIHDICIL